MDELLRYGPLLACSQFGDSTHRNTFVLDGVFCASCPAPPGCVSNGTMYDETVATMREALASHLEVLVDHGDPIPEPRSIGTEYIDVAV